MTHAFSTTPRLRLTEQQRAKIFLERGGRCEGPCGQIIRAGKPWHLDHKVALENGGTNELSNLQILCFICHKPKTASDHRDASRSRDKAVAHVVPGQYREKSSLSKRPGTRFNWRKGRYERVE